MHSRINGIWKFWRGENWRTQRKTSWSKRENPKKLNPHIGVDAGIWTPATLLGGRCFHQNSPLIDHFQYIILNSYLAPRLGKIKQKKCIIHYWASRWFLLFYCPKPQIQVRILIYQKWSIKKMVIYKGRKTSLSWLSSFSEYLLEALLVVVSSVFISLPHLEWLHVRSHLV